MCGRGVFLLSLVGFGFCWQFAEEATLQNLKERGERAMNVLVSLLGGDGGV